VIPVVAGAIVLVVPDVSGNENRRRSETLAGSPVACLDVLGQSILSRMIERLQHAGIKAISVVADDVFSDSVLSPLAQPADAVQFSDNVLGAAEHKLRYYAGQGVQIVLLMRMGPYLEFDIEDLLEFHRDQNKRFTRVSDSEGVLDFWVICNNTATRVCDAGTIGLDRLAKAGQSSGVASYLAPGYVNRLRDARDLRRLVRDAFASRCAIRATGREVKLRVWVDEGARVHRRARIVAPAYVGRGTRVGADTLITRSSNVEHHCDVSYGTVVEDACILPHTYLGTGLDVSHAVVCGSQLVNLRLNVCVDIGDASLLRSMRSADTAKRMFVIPEPPLSDSRDFNPPYKRQM